MDLQAVTGNIVSGGRKLKVPLCGQSLSCGQSPLPLCIPTPRVETPGEISWRVRFADGGNAWIQEERGGADGVEMPLAGGIGIQGTLHTCVIISYFLLHRSFRCCQLEAPGQPALLEFT